MNCFNETEKSLKRYLKSKVTISMATIVGFMIAGTVTFGADSGWKDIPDEPNFRIDNKVVKNSTDNPPYINQATISGTSLGSEETIEFGSNFYGGESAISSGNVYKDIMTTTTKDADSIREIGKFTDSSIATIVITGDETVDSSQISGAVTTVGDDTPDDDGILSHTAINYADVWVKGNAAGMLGDWAQDEKLINKGNIYADTDLGVKDSSGNKLILGAGALLASEFGYAHDFTNDGNIYVNSGYGIYKKETGNSTIINNGLIQVTGKVTGEGKDKTVADAVHINWGSDFTNNGTIDGGEGHAILVDGSYIDYETELPTELKVLNTKDGTITGTTGIEVAGSNYGYANATKLNLNIENNGNINTTSAGIFTNPWENRYNNVTITNSGDIKVVGSAESTNGLNGIFGIYAGTKNDKKLNHGVTKVTNEGTITVDGTAGKYAYFDSEKNQIVDTAAGVSLHEMGTLANEEGAEINVIGNGMAGVYVSGGTSAYSGFEGDYSTFENAGTITAKGDNSVGLLVRHEFYNEDGSIKQYTDDDQTQKNLENAKMILENTETGNIKVEGKDVVGVRLSHSYVNDKLNDASANVTFTNNGTIELTGDNTTGTGVLVNTGAFTNAGNILANGNTAIKVTANNSTINLTEGSHIEGLIDLAGKNDTLDINGVGLDKQETINVLGDNDNIVINNSNINVTGKLTNETGAAISMNNKNGNNALVNNATIVAETGIGVKDTDQDTSNAAIDRTISITNNGDITAKHYGIYNNGYYTKYNGVNITNNGNILVTDFIIDEKTYDRPYYYSNGIYQASGTYTKIPGVVKNTGDIKITLNDEQNAQLKKVYEETKGNMYLNIHGLRLHEHSEGENTGNIIVNAYGGNGVVLSAGDTGANNNKDFLNRYNYFENIGNISVTGENGIGLSLKNTTLAKVEAVNEGTGVITVNGDNAIAVKVDGEHSEFTNRGNLVLGEQGTGKKAIVLANGGKASNNGIIQVLGTELDGVTNNKDALAKLFEGTLTSNLGLIVDKDGHAMFAGSGNENTEVSGSVTSDTLDKVSEIDGSLTLNGTELSQGANNSTITSQVINVVGSTTKIAEGSNISMEVKNINIDNDGELALAGNSTLNLANGTLQDVAGTDHVGVTIEDTAELALANMNIQANITNNGTIHITAGENSLDGAIRGNGMLSIDKDGILNLSSNSSMVSHTSTKATLATNTNPSMDIDGTTNVEIGSKVDNKGVYTENFFANSSNLSVTGNGDIVLDTANISGAEAQISLGADNNFESFSGDITTKLGNDALYVVSDKKIQTGNGNIVSIEYNQNLFADNSTINDINKQAYNVDEYLSQDKATREKQIDTLYTNNIYSETARASYDMMKLNEESILSLNTDAKVGEWAAAGKALYNKTKYDRTGTLAKYSSETETSGLMAGLEYGVNDTTAVGVAFSGAYQDIDTDGGSADGNVFFLGAYGQKEFGKLSLTAGLGYQYGDYDSDNTAGDKASSASYDVNAYSAYVEGRYALDLGDNVTLEPKLKLGYTYVDQENIADNYFRLNDSELSTFDTEIGADLVKTVDLESGKLDVRFGASYVKAFGDTDDKFSGEFIGAQGSFDVYGAEIAEDTAKLDLGVEITKDSGTFYNVGGTLRVGSDETRDYSVRLGAGYRF